jgi:hypothetical protein
VVRYDRQDLARGRCARLALYCGERLAGRGLGGWSHRGAQRTRYRRCPVDGRHGDADAATAAGRQSMHIPGRGWCSPSWHGWARPRRRRGDCTEEDGGSAPQSTGFAPNASPRERPLRPPQDAPPLAMRKSRWSLSLVRNLDSLRTRGRVLQSRTSSNLMARVRRQADFSSEAAVS